jgi:hypothetical protein
MNKSKKFAGKCSFFVEIMRERRVYNSSMVAVKEVKID